MALGIAVNHSEIIRNIAAENGDVAACEIGKNSEWTLDSQAFPIIACEVESE
jgi:hypothetical protein